MEKNLQQRMYRRGRVPWLVYPGALITLISYSHAILDWQNRRGVFLVSRRQMKHRARNGRTRQFGWDRWSKSTMEMRRSAVQACVLNRKISRWVYGRAASRSPAGLWDLSRLDLVTSQ